MPDEAAAPLCDWLAGALAARIVAIAGIELLRGGAAGEAWRVVAEVDGERRAFVLHSDAHASNGLSRTRADEFVLVRTARAAGVSVAEPIASCADPGIVGSPFALYAAVGGTGFGPRLVSDLSLGGERTALLARLGRELALIHAITPPRPDLDFLGSPPAQPAREEVGRVRRRLDAMGAVRPALEWGLRWAEVNAPRPERITLVHRDFRTGNYAVDREGLTAILAWEHAGWGDPWSDLGSFCAECWRFGRRDLEAGGLGPRATFYRGYAAGSGVAVDDEAVRFWEVVAHLRATVMALERGGSHASPPEPALQDVLAGRAAAELELAIMRATAPATWRAGHAG